MFKPRYDIYDKVRVRSLDKVGTICKWTHMSGQSSTQYQVRYEEDYWNIDSYFPVSEYLGKKPIFVEVNEEDLELIVDPKIESDILDAMKYMKYMMVSPENYFISTVSSEELDKIAQQMDVASRVMVNCTHSWKSYQGLMQSYDYCEKCDEKRNK